MLCSDSYNSKSTDSEHLKVFENTCAVKRKFQNFQSLQWSPWMGYKMSENTGGR